MVRLVPLVLLAALVGLAGFSARDAAPPPLDRPALEALRDALAARARGWVEAGGPRREDGFVYAVDVAHLMEHAALAADRPLYDRLRAFADAHLVLDDPADPYTRGFVAWRAQPGTPPDASGTTEALRLARALWRGAAAFDRPADRARAALLLDGWRRHAYVDQGVWHVRNYFNLGTRAFANDSYLVDYDPDFVADVAAATGDAALAEAARQSLELIEAARSPSGLLHTLVQPDLRTMYPEVPVRAFSPNDLIQLNNACFVAETVLTGAPAVADAALAFATARLRHLKRWYYGRTGEAATDRAADLAVYSCFARLAARRGNALTTRRWVAAALPWWRAMVEDPVDRYYTLGETLLTLDHLLAAPPRG